jgi:hypothetical protein
MRTSTQLGNQQDFDEARKFGFVPQVPRHSALPLRSAAHQAEQRIVEWLDAHPEASDPGRCAWCGQAEKAGSVIVPFGTQNHTWLHADCWGPWYQSRCKLDTSKNLPNPDFRNC